MKMAHLPQSLYSVARPDFPYPGKSGQVTDRRRIKLTWSRFPVIVRCASTESLTSLTRNAAAAAEIELKYVVSQHGWGVRRLKRDDEEEIRTVSLVQAEAFHIPLAFFNDFFFLFFQVSFTLFACFIQNKQLQKKFHIGLFVLMYIKISLIYKSRRKVG